MSHELVFYKVSRVTEDLPTIINTDDVEFPYFNVRTEEAADWEKEIGIIRTMEYSTVDQFAACEKLFGKKPQSIRVPADYYLHPNGPWAELDLSFPDGERKSVHRREMEKFRTNVQYQAYVYRRDEIARVETGYKVESEGYEERPLSEKDLLEMARQYLNEYGNDYGGYTYEPDPMVMIMKSFFAVADGDCIVCDSV